jgi:hypothetical protein
MCRSAPWAVTSPSKQMRIRATTTAGALLTKKTKVKRRIKNLTLHKAVITYNLGPAPALPSAVPRLIDS